MRKNRTSRHPALYTGSRLVVGLATLSLVALCWASVSNATQLVIDFGFFCGSQQSNPVDSPAFGGGSMVIDTVANTLTFEVSFGNLSSAETTAHIHGPADPGADAAVVFTLPAGNPKIGVWNYPESLQSDLLAGRMYMDIHTVDHPGGEIRSQVTDSFAFMDGAQETPPVTTSGYGVGVFHLNTQTHQLKYYVVTDDLSGIETAAYIRGFALHGTAGAILDSLPLGSPKVGVFNYSADQEEGIRTGQAYLEIRTTTHPGGEIRGQIVAMVVPMDGAQEVPPNASTAAGMALTSFDPTTYALSYYVWTSGLGGSEIATHLHGYAPRGMNAGILQTLPIGVRKLGMLSFGAAQWPSVFSGNTYLDEHSMAFPAGEIRGQIEGFYHRSTTDVTDPGAADLSMAARIHLGAD